MNLFLFVFCFFFTFCFAFSRVRRPNNPPTPPPPPFIKTFQSQTFLRELQQTCRATKSPAPPLLCPAAVLNTFTAAGSRLRSLDKCWHSGAAAGHIDFMQPFIYQRRKSDKERLARLTLMTYFASLTHFVRRLHCGLTAAHRLSQWCLAVTVIKERVPDPSRPLSPFFLSTCVRVACHCDAGSPP